MNERKVILNGRDPYEAAQNYYEKFYRGTLSRRGGNMDWIPECSEAERAIFFSEIERLFPGWKLRIQGDYFSLEEPKRDQNKKESKSEIDRDEER